MRNNKKPSVKRDKGSSGGYIRRDRSSGDSPAHKKKRIKDSDTCYDFTNDHDINPPRDERKKK